MEPENTENNKHDEKSSQSIPSATLENQGSNGSFTKDVKNLQSDSLSNQPKERVKSNVVFSKGTLDKRATIDRKKMDLRSTDGTSDEEFQSPKNSVVLQLQKEKLSEEEKEREQARQKAREEEAKTNIHRFYSFMTWRISLISLPIPILIILLIVFGSIGMIFLMTSPNSTASEAYLYSWMFWTDYLLITFVFAEVLVKLVWLLIKQALFYSKFYYYINDVDSTLAFLIWSILHLSSWRKVLDLVSGVHTDTSFYISKLFETFLYVSLCRCFKLIGEKVLLSRMHKQVFWKSVSEFLFKEKALAILLNEPRQKHVVSPILEVKGGGKPEIAHYEFRKMREKILRFESLEVEKHKSNEGTIPEAVETANRLFSNVDSKNKGFFVLDDLKPFFKSNIVAEEVFSLFDKEKKGDVVLEEVIMFVRQVFKDRKALYNTLHDREDIAALLTSVFGAIFWFLMFLLSLAVFGVNMNELLLPLGTTFVGFAFIFGESIKNGWDNFLFIFLVRPYDIGDRITLEGYPTLVVSRIHLTITEAFSTDGRHFIVPNAIMRNNIITQYKRSKDYTVWINVHMGNNTSKDQINKLMKRLRKWLSQDKSANWKHDEALFWISDITNLNRITLDIWAEIRGVNWQVPRLYLIPRSNLWLEIQRLCKELNITYTMPSQPVYLTQSVPSVVPTEAILPPYL